MQRRPRLLIINPNTSETVSASIDALARHTLGDDAEIRTVTAPFGLSYLFTRVAVSIAAHAALDAAAREAEGGYAADAVVVGCFGDPGREALAEMLGVPVVGFAEAGLVHAASLPGRSIVAVHGSIWCEMLSELVLRLGISHKITGIVSIEGHDEVASSLADYVTRQALVHGAERVIVGGAGLIGIIPDVAAAAGVPVVDPHRIAILQAQRLAQARLRAAPSQPGGSARGLSPALARLAGAPVEIPSLSSAS